MRHRYLTNQSRIIPQLAGLGQDFFADWGTDVTSYDTGTAVDVPLPATNQGTDSWFTTITNAAQKLLPVAIAAKQTSDINQINLDRARRGQAPLSAAYMSAMAPRVNVGMSPDTQNMLVFGGLALAAVIGLSMLSRR
jgi:hypothetical protein